MEKAYDVLNVGILCTDILLKIPCNTIDFSVDSLVLEAVPVFPGGDAANVAQVMARLGKKTALAALIGDDIFGRAVYKTVEQSGVDMRYTRQDDSLQTTISVVLINAKGARSFLFLPGSLREFTLKDIDPAAIRQARHVNFGSFFAHPKMDRGGARELFKLAKESGATTSADVTHDSYGTGFEGMKDSLRYLDYFMPSYVEGKYLTGESEPERIADVFIREAVDITVVLKMGEEGCFIKSRGRCIRSRSYPAAAVDTTGAGDNFVAGFLTGLSNGWELEECAEFANAVAGFSVQQLGATSPDMSMERIREFINAAGNQV